MLTTQLNRHDARMTFINTFFIFRLQHELQEKDKVIETLQLRLQSKADMQSIALSPFSSPSRRFVETQTSPAASPQVNGEIGQLITRLPS